jgi:hypothetical protein
MAIHHEKMKKKHKKSKVITKGEQLGEVAKNPFKVPQPEISETGKKP